MPTYNVKARRTSPVTDVSVYAPTKEDAISQVVSTTLPGESTEILQAVETAPDVVEPAMAVKK